jgi:hypothetical protein
MGNDFVSTPNPDDSIKHAAFTRMTTVTCISTLKGNTGRPINKNVVLQNPEDRLKNLSFPPDCNTNIAQDIRSSKHYGDERSHKVMNGNSQ